MAKSPKDLAINYITHGVPVFPCRYADEVTDRYDPETGEFEVLKAKTPLISNGFKGASKNLRVTGILWDRNPTAMVGIPTGEQLGAWVLDVDMHKDEAGNIVNGYETLAALEAKHGELPATATARTAGGGEHRYFNYVPGVRNRGKLGAGLDVRGSGGYVIAPGSVTAEGNEYVWLDYDEEGLPPLADAPQWLLDLVLPPAQSHAANDYVYQAGSNDAYVDRAIQLELEETASVPMGAGRNNRLNQAAFALGTLVGANALAESEARALLQDVARGWGRDWAQCCKTIENGLAAGTKQPREIPEPTYQDDGTPPIDTGRLVANKLAKDSAPPPQQDAQPEPEPHPEEDEPPEYKLEAVADLESLTYPGGLVEDLIDWIVSSAEQPSRTLALAAVLPLVSSLCGPRYSTGSHDTRPNIYTVALAESGFGKEHARSQIKRLLMSDHGIFSKFSGPARIMSASALREVLEANQSVNCQIDEFGGFVRDITDRKAGSHQRAISTDLRDYYSASSTFFEGAAYRGSPPKRIYNPNLCIHGTSTPDQFWSALSSASAEDGLLPRLILFHITGKKPRAVTPAADVRQVPHILLSRMADVAGINVAAVRGNLGKLGYKADNDTSVETAPTIVKWTPDAIGILSSVKETIEAKESMVAAESRPFVRRIIENAIKLALIVAVGTDPQSPMITEAIFEWAAAVAWTCAASMLAEVGERLSDNQREANYKKIQALIKKAGDKGVTEGRIADRCKAIDGWQRDEILKDLHKTGQVIVADNDNKVGRPKRRLVWVG
ncbi:bifunctional DNA primase/polymerase [Rhizobium leguminosarum]